MLIDLPFPHDYLWPNKRPRKIMAFRTKAAKHRAWAAIAAMEVMPKCFKHNGERIPVTIHVHARSRGPLPDKDNCVAAAKSSLDGIADALGINDQLFEAPKVVFADERDGRFVVELF